jgi:HEPN domain-containing protein
MEKYLKGRLVEAGLPFPKTHDLVAILSLVATIEPLWAIFSAPMMTITKWAVLARYPGVWTTNVEAKEAVKLCRRFRKIARASLGL